MTLNLLLLANGPSANLPVIIEKYQKVDYVGLISNQDPGYRKNDYFFYRDCVFGVYDENEYSKNISIGKDLLHELMLCESQFMKMMERFEQWGGLHAYEHRINLYHKQLKHWYGYLTKNKINLCVFHTIPHFGYDFIIYSLCKIINIKVVMFQRIPVLIGHNVSLYAFDDLEKHIVGLKERYEYYLKHPRKIELEPRFSEYFSLQKSNTGKTFTGASVKHRNTFVNTLMTLVRAIKTRLPVWKLYKRYYRWHDIFSRAIQLISLFEHTKIQYVKHPDTDVNYVFVPLHYQPEASTSPLGDVFVYLDLMIDILDQGLPDDCRIYV